MIYPYVRDDKTMLSDSKLELAAVNDAQRQLELLAVLEEYDFTDRGLWLMFSCMVPDKDQGVINPMLTNEAIHKHPSVVGWMKNYGWASHLAKADYKGPWEQIHVNLRLLRMRRAATEFTSKAGDAEIPQEFISMAAELAQLLPKDQSVQEIANMMGIKRKRIRSGYHMLDSCGSVPMGSVVVIASETAVGKTTLAINIMARMLKNKLSVHYVTLEMQAETIATRLMQCANGVSAEEAIEGAENLMEFQGRLEIDDKKINFADILGSMSSKAMSDVHIIDHLHIINYGKESRGRLQELESMTRGFKEFAQSNDKIVILLSQLNRDISKRNSPPQLSDLRGSGSIEQDADIVTMLHDPQRRENESEANTKRVAEDLGAEIQEGDREWYIRKNRHGRKGQCKLRLEPITMTFREIDENL